MDPDNSHKISHHVSNIIITPVYTHVASLSSHNLRHADLLLKQDPGLRMSSKNSNGVTEYFHFCSALNLNICLFVSYQIMKTATEKVPELTKYVR